MAGTKVDVQAVQAELNAICSRMTGITRLMGPQVWQGGSAGNFTTDLQGHNRSLDVMMLRVLRAVAALNDAVMVLDPPDIPSVTPQPALSNGIASVSPNGLRQLESNLRFAAEALPRHGSRIQSLLSAAGPHDVSTDQCKRAAAWCSGQARQMRTRIHYALASDNVSPMLGVMNRGLAQIPDADRFGHSELEQLAKLQAQAYKGQLDDPMAGSRDLLADIGASLRENSKDTNYLRTFFGNVPPGSVGKLGYDLHRRHKDDAVLDSTDKKILGDFGTGLAALSQKKHDKASNDALWRALGPAGSDMPSQAMLVKLSAPDIKWGSDALAELGKAALRWRQTYPSYEIDESSGTFAGESHSKLLNQPHREWFKDWGISDGSLQTLRQYDAALNVLGRINQQNDTAAARKLAGAELDGKFTIKDAAKAKALTFLTRSDGGTYASLLVAPDWLDKGSAAGSVIRLATTAEKGHEDEAAQNAAEIMKSVAWWNEIGRTKVDKLLRNTGTPDWYADSKHYKAEYGDGLQDGLLQMTRMHLPTLAANRTSGGSPQVRTDPVSGQRYVDLDGDDVQQFLRTFASDDRRFGLLDLYAEQYRQQVYAWGLRNRLQIDTAHEIVGRLEGNLISGYRIEKISREELTKADWQQTKEHLTIVRDVTKLFLEQSRVGQNPVVGLGYDKGTDLLLSKVEYKEFTKRVDAIKNKDANYTDQLLVDLARGYKANFIGPISDPQIDALLRKEVLSPDERRHVAGWSKQHIYLLRSEEQGTKQQTGDNLIGATERIVDHQMPPSN